VQLLPTKLIGVIADHGEFPIEKIAVDRGGEGRWVGSAGHEEVLRLTDLKAVFADEGEEGEGEGEGEEKQESDLDDDGSSSAARSASDRDRTPRNSAAPRSEDDNGSDDDNQADEPKQKKRKRKQGKDVLAGRKKKGRDHVDADPSFFSAL
jgi:hypothetical protein